MKNHEYIFILFGILFLPDMLYNLDYYFKHRNKIHGAGSVI